MEPKFKVGDKVVHAPNGDYHGTEADLLRLGNAVHTIIKIVPNTTCGGGRLIKTNLYPEGAYDTRFKLAQSYINEQKMKKLLGVSDE